MVEKPILIADALCDDDVSWEMECPGKRRVRQNNIYAEGQPVLSLRPLRSVSHGFIRFHRWFEGECHSL